VILGRRDKDEGPSTTTGGQRPPLRPVLHPWADSVIRGPIRSVTQVNETVMRPVMPQPPGQSAGRRQESANASLFECASLLALYVPPPAAVWRSPSHAPGAGSGTERDSHPDQAHSRGPFSAGRGLAPWESGKGLSHKIPIPESVPRCGWAVRDVRPYWLEASTAGRPGPRCGLRARPSCKSWNPVKIN